jgi:hypothetical protein
MKKRSHPILQQYPGKKSVMKTCKCHKRGQVFPGIALQKNRRHHSKSIRTKNLSNRQEVKPKRKEIKGSAAVLPFTAGVSEEIGTLFL